MMNQQEQTFVESQPVEIREKLPNPKLELVAQLFMVNTKTNQRSIVKLPVCYLSDQRIDKEGETLFAYIRCPDGTDSDGYRQEGIYRMPLNGYLP